MKIIIWPIALTDKSILANVSEVHWDDALNAVSKSLKTVIPDELSKRDPLSRWTVADDWPSFRNAEKPTVLQIQSAF